MSKAQMEIPGTERPVIKAIENAAEAYVSARDKRMKALENEIALKTKLIEVMENNADKLGVDADGNLLYRYDEEVVILSKLDTVKVKKAVAETGDSE